MLIKDFLATTDLERSLLIGYYGGGNFGDELLLEVLLAQLAGRGLKNLSFAYREPGRYRQYHHDFGATMVTGQGATLRSALRARSVIIGGGGLWGVDVNLSILVLSLLLFGLRLLGKRVYLIGVGYYGSTTPLGRLSAWFAAKAANQIIARDDETAANFRAISRSVAQDYDIAWLVPELDLAPYAAEADQLERQVTVRPSTVYVTFRASHGGQRRYQQLIGELIEHNPKTPFVLSLLWPEPDTPTGDARFARDLQRHHANVQILEAFCNPLALALFFKRHAHELRFITPQYHAILIAGLYRIPVAPIAYDNKVRQLLKQQGATSIIADRDLSIADLQHFIDQTAGRSEAAQ